MAVSSPPASLPSRFKAPSSSVSTNKPAISKHHSNIKPIPTTDRVDRTSFSSIKENYSGGIAQTFTDSKTSSYLRNSFTSSSSGEAVDEDAILDDVSVFDGTRTPERKTGMLTNPHSLLHGFVCPCDGFKGWKGITLAGRMASKSSGDLKGLGMRWDWEEAQRGDPMEIDGRKDLVMVKGRYLPGKSPLESLPMELLGAIIDQLSTDIPPNGFTPRNMDLMSLLLTSRGMHGATLSTLYAQITIPHSRIFRKFLTHIIDHPSLGTIVRRLDFSHFNPTGAGWTARERAETLNLIPATLLQCLKLTPNLREFLAQEHIDDEMDSKVIQTLLCDLPKLKAIDFTACSSASFRDAFNTVIDASPSPLPSALSITRLSFHECSILPSSVFESLLPRLTRLTHLDVAHTRITDLALASIPHTARLTHLNLSKCSHLSGAAVVNFLATHPAAKSLIYLNLAMDVKSHEMLTSEDVTAVLPVLPSTLRSLNLKGSKMNKSHIPLLLPLSKHVEELGLGRQLDLPDISRLFTPDEDLELEEQMEWIPHTLRYIDVSDLNVAQLDLSTLFGSSCPVLKGIAEPLEVVEVGNDVYKKLEGSKKVVERAGWCVQEAGRRGWLVRVPTATTNDNGARDWKWGACYWGMRKIPVARAEVGGMYGHYMFKR